MNIIMLGAPGAGKAHRLLYFVNTLVFPQFQPET